MGIEDLVTDVVEYNARRPDYVTFRNYYRGNQELKYATEQFRNEYGRDVQGLRENLCPAVVQAFTDELGIADWGEGNQEAEKNAALKRLVGKVNTETFRAGDGFVLLAKRPDGTVVPIYQRADQIVPTVDETDPGGPLARATRIWQAGKFARANVYYPDGHVERWITDRELSTTSGQRVVLGQLDTQTDAKAWKAYTDTAGKGSVPHGFDGTPVFWWRQDADSDFEHGRSILVDVIPLQDALNKSLADLIVLSGAYAKPFWYLLNYRPSGAAANNPLLAAQEFAAAFSQVSDLMGVPTNGAVPVPAAGEALTRSSKFDRTKQSIFTHDGPGPFGQLQPPDMTKVMDVQDRLAMKVARVVGMPSFYISQTSGDVPSGQSLRVLKSRMTSRIGNFQRDNQPEWERMATMLGMKDVAITWDNPHQLDPLELVDMAVAKHRDLGYALPDAIKDLDEPDAEGIVLRALESSNRAAQAVQDGGLGYGTVDQTLTVTR